MLARWGFGPVFGVECFFDERYAQAAGDARLWIAGYLVVALLLLLHTLATFDRRLGRMNSRTPRRQGPPPDGEPKRSAISLAETQS